MIVFCLKRPSLLQLFNGNAFEKEEKVIIRMLKQAAYVDFNILANVNLFPVLNDFEVAELYCIAKRNTWYLSYYPFDV